MPTTCTKEGFAPCPQGYSCQQQLETNNYYCCTSPDEGLNGGCPPYQFAYFVDNQIKTCDPFNSLDSACPHHYSCQWSLKNHEYQCCGFRSIKQTKMKIDDGCLNRHYALIDLKSGRPRVCMPGEENSCPIGFFCQFSPRNFHFQCCGQSGGCPPRRAVYIMMNGKAQECLPGSDVCTKGYKCVMSLIEKKHICCSEDGDSAIRIGILEEVKQ